MDFLTYKTFHEQERTAALTEILTKNNIEFEVTEDRESLDSLYGDKHLNRQFFVKIRESDFQKADSILLNENDIDLDKIDENHYLYEFSDEELFEVLSKRDEWNELDFQLAKKILKDKGKEINDDTINLLRQQRIKELAKPEDDSKIWIYAGYLFSLLGGILGIFMGLALITSKKTLPNGQKVHTYSEGHRKHGVRIFIIGIIMFSVSLLIKITTTEF